MDGTNAQKKFGEGKESKYVPAYKLDGRPSELFVGFYWYLCQKIEQTLA
jgi:hypothetical protein